MKFFFSSSSTPISPRKIAAKNFHKTFIIKPLSSRSSSEAYFLCQWWNPVAWNSEPSPQMTYLGAIRTFSSPESRIVRPTVRLAGRYLFSTKLQAKLKRVTAVVFRRYAPYRPDVIRRSHTTVKLGYVELRIPCTLLSDHLFSVQFLFFFPKSWSTFTYPLGLDVFFWCEIWTQSVKKKTCDFGGCRTICKRNENGQARDLFLFWYSVFVPDQL